MDASDSSAEFWLDVAQTMDVQQDLSSRSWQDETVKSGKMIEADWWLWDGKEERRIGKLPEKYHDLSLRESWNDTLLIERIVSGWRPADEV